MDFLLGLIIGGGFVWAYYKYGSVQRMLWRKKFDLGDYGNQLRFIEEAQLQSKQPVNKEAVKVLYMIEDYAAQKRTKLRVLAEVGLGAFIKTSSGNGTAQQQKRAFSSFNSKRVDFLLIDSSGNPLVAIEHQGSGHVQDTQTAGRDAVKKRALQLAGIPLIETRPATTREELFAQLNSHLNSIS